MKAVQISSYGGNEVLEINENASKPIPARNQLLIKVEAASLNPVDKAIRAGYLKEIVPLPLPTTLGGDFSGIIKEVGEGVSEFKIGDHVYGQGNTLSGGSGSFAEFLIANDINTAHKPRNINFIEAAALPIAGVSALQALEENINIKPGQKILIHGGAGGIGSIAIQIAKFHGAFVAATVSKDDIDFAKKIGADQVIDYRNESFEEILREFDATLDTVGGDITKKSFKVLRKGGVLVSMLGQPDKELVNKYGIKAIGQNTNTNKQNLDRLTKLIDSGNIKVIIDKVFPIIQIRDAFLYLEQGHPKGKVVLKC